MIYWRCNNRPCTSAKTWLHSTSDRIGIDFFWVLLSSSVMLYRQNEVHVSLGSICFSKWELGFWFQILWREWSSRNWEWGNIGTGFIHWLRSRNGAYTDSHPKLIWIPLSVENTCLLQTLNPPDCLRFWLYLQNEWQLTSSSVGNSKMIFGCNSMIIYWYWY